ncbi:MAG: 4Fe-4S dicluster domain-containing protein [Chloroflexi bacterium]|nr:4Fe-4S dicluster domain-containing protein [Chloroflexota bacterium]
MLGFLDGLKITLKTAGRKPVTAEYPAPDKRLDVQPRYMGFPALTWDGDVGEPYCTGCMVCIRNCPTQCMSAKMQDNPLHAEGKSRRRKIIDEFEINLARCILCGICVDVCNFDAIEMSHEHELSKYERNGNRADLPALLDMGKKYQQATAWQPKQPEKNSGVPPPPKALPKAVPPETSPDKPAPIELVVVSREAVERRNAVMRERAAERERESRGSTDHSAGSGQPSSRTESDD